MRGLVIIFTLLAGLARADDVRVQFYAAPELVESGLIQHIRPRFSLKTSVGVDIVSDPAVATLLIWDQGDPVFAGLGQVWYLERPGAHEGSDRFARWITSEIGQRTITGFAPEGRALFATTDTASAPAQEAGLSADAQAGREVAFARCGRCHVTETERRMTGIGSTPSFPVLRSLDNWDYRFAAFYTLKPHPAFTQIEDLTEPFPAHQPPPLVPVELTLDELDALLAYVEGLAPADLGEALELQ